jgi:hypothetical protein
MRMVRRRTTGDGNGTRNQFSLSCSRHSGRRRGLTKELTRPRDGLGAARAGKQAVVADAVGSLWQHMDQEAAHELAGVERHRRIPAGAFDPVVLDLERNAR